MTKRQPRIAGSTICGIIDPSTGWACSRIGRHDEHVAFEDHDEESEELARWPSESVERDRKLEAEQAEARLNTAAPQLLEFLKRIIVAGYNLPHQGPCEGPWAYMMKEGHKLIELAETGKP